MPIFKTRQFCKIRDRDTQGLVHCEAKIECNEPGARAEGIAQENNYK